MGGRAREQNPNEDRQNRLRAKTVALLKTGWGICSKCGVWPMTSRFAERPARRNLTGRWIARAQHDDISGAYTYQVGGACQFFW